MAEITTVTDGKQQELLDRMRPPTRTRALEAVRQRETNNKGYVLLAHNLGSWMREMTERRDKYGDDAVNEFCAFLNLDPKGAYVTQAVNLAERWTRDDLAAETSTPLRNQQPLSLMHFVYLGRIEAPAQRRQILARVRAESMSAQELLETIRGELDAKNVRAGGRLPTVPNSPLGGLRKLAKQSNQLANYGQQFLQRIAPRLDTLDDDQVTDKYFNELQRTRERVMAAMEMGQAALKILDEDIEDAERRLTHNNEAVGEAEDISGDEDMSAYSTGLPEDDAEAEALAAEAEATVDAEEPETSKDPEDEGTPPAPPPAPTLTSTQARVFRNLKTARTAKTTRQAQPRSRPAKVNLAEEDEDVA